MEVGSSLNDSLVLRRRSSRRCRSVTLDNSLASSIKKECEIGEQGGGRGSSGDDEQEDQTPATNTRPTMRGRKKKKLKKSSLVKRGHVEKNRMIVAPVLRRSKREKRLLFTTFNVSQIDKQILNANNEFPDLDLSEEEMDPYEKLLSPHRVTRNSSRTKSDKPPSVASASGSASKIPKVQGQGGGGETEEGEEEDSANDKEKSGSPEGESEDQSEDEDEEVGGYYNLRKRQPVIYHFQPVHHVVEDDTPPKKRRGRRSQSHSTYHTRARVAAPRAYQSNQGGRGTRASPRKRQAHHDSSSTSSDSDTDEARFRRRKSRSMAKARSQCLPMNFTPDDLAQGVIRDRIRIGASLADVNPMNVDRSVTFDSIGGLKNHIRALKEMIIFPLLYPEVFERFQINPPRGVLFHGPPGCGKTLVARALANECSKGGKKVAFFMRKGADCLSKWVGESERQLRLLFDQAYQVRPSIIFFDEIDGLAPVRSSRQDQIHSSIVSTLLALMDGLDSRGEIVVIGATNRIDAIDPALRRPGRFDREFIFPLPSREDRHSILSIHTKGWNPRLKAQFLLELADHTVGYCGADLRALCTEAALFALRRRYPQIYKASDKLVLDISKINVSASDFHNALKSIVPTAQRSDSAVALALPEHVRPFFLDALERLLHLLCFVFPPTWKLVKKAGAGLESLTSADRARVTRVEGRLAELRETTGLSLSLSVTRVEKAGPSSFVRGGKRRSLNHHDSDLRNKPGPSISNWSGEFHFRGDRKRSKSISPPQNHSSSKRARLSTSKGGDLLGESSATTSSMALSSYNQLFLRHSQSAELGKVFFDLTEISSDDYMTDDAGHAPHPHCRHANNSILEAVGVASDTEASPSTPPLPPPSTTATKLQSTCYLNFSSHPHTPPSVHHPRLMLCGQPGMGQSSYLGPALLHALEDLPVRTLDLAALFGSSTRSPEEACSQTFRELSRVTPSILFLPRLDTWWEVTSETFQMTLLSSLTSILPSKPLLVLATAECLWEQLPPKLKEVFPDSGSQVFSVLPPTLDQRKLFFYEVLLEKPFLPPPPKPKLLSDIPVEELPVASPPRPRELNKAELSRIVNHRESVLRELRVFLRDATNKLLAERKFKEFTKPVDPEEVPDYHDIISEPMDLGTMMKKIDEQRYTVPKQWIADVELIARNALEYNPEHGAESRLLRHRAVALQDMAHSFLDHELSEDFEKQCEDIAESYNRIERTQGDTLKQVMGSGSGLFSSPQQHPPGGGGAAANATGGGGGTSSNTNGHLSTLKSELYDAPRRSLRQKGLGPEEKGFPYYSPPKPRTPSKAGRGGEGETSTSQSDGDTLERSMVVEEGEGDKEDVTPSLYGTADGDTTAHRSRLTNTSVRRQIIRPWEDGAGSSGGRGERRNGMTRAAPIGGTTNSVQVAVEALVAMATPTKEESAKRGDGGRRDDDDNMTLSSDSDDETCYQLAAESADTAPKKKPDDITCNGSGKRSGSGSPADAVGAGGKVSVDGAGLARVFERVVRGTEGCSIVEMERIHTTYQQLVFRHRMSWQRDALLEDLKLTTDLFLQELGR